MTIAVKNIHKRFGDFVALDNISLDFPAGELTALLGPSGCGKTTLLRIIAGLETPSSGGAYLDGKEIVAPGPQIGLVFQSYKLFPWKTVRQNVEIGLEVRGLEPAKVREVSHHYLGMVGLHGFEDYYPHQLSGGMRQRVMIAMALACNPKIIIADEPTTALDVTIQAQILDLLRSLKDRINSSIMLITHDLGVIAEMADYVVVMYAGRVVEKGTVEEIFAHPSHPYTIGLMASKPVVGKKVDRLYSIPGKVPNPVNMPNYCYFKDRCEMALPCCDGEYPCEISLSPTHKVSCYRYYEENRKAGE